MIRRRHPAWLATYPFEDAPSGTMPATSVHRSMNGFLYITQRKRSKRRWRAKRHSRIARPTSNEHDHRTDQWSPDRVYDIVGYATFLPSTTASRGGIQRAHHPTGDEQSCCRQNRYRRPWIVCPLDRRRDAFAVVGMIEGKNHGNADRLVWPDVVHLPHLGRPLNNIRAMVMLKKSEVGRRTAWRIRSSLTRSASSLSINAFSDRFRCVMSEKHRPHPGACPIHQTVEQYCQQCPAGCRPRTDTLRAKRGWRQRLQ